MNDEEAEKWREAQIAATKYRSKLREARERKGLTIHEAAALMDCDVNTSGYYDIEQHERDFTYCYSLNEIKRVCEHFDIHPRDIFCDKLSPAISISEVIEKIKRHCNENKLSIVQFEDIAGWRLESCLANPARALEEWNIDCLIDVSRELNIDWRGVIAGL
jgi:DNA-binding XRE family transcriptional regulator